MIFYVISIIIGVLVSIMIPVNGELTGFYGVYLATAMIHLIGLICISAWCFKKKVRLFFGREIPFRMYLGGAIGVITTVFSSLAYGKISVTAIIALGLLGQTITSLVIDQLGLFQMAKRPFHKSELIGIFFVLGGIIVMLMDSKLLIIPIVLSLLTGLSVVTSRTINAGFSLKTSVLTSTWYNFFVGFCVSLLLLFVLSPQALPQLTLLTTPKLWWFTGGILGVAAIILCNIAVSKISSFHMTLCLFVGQIFAGVLLDAIIAQTFLLNNLIGGTCVAIGLAINLWLNNRQYKLSSATL